MYELVERFLFKVKEVVDVGLYFMSQFIMMKKIESYEVKKIYYGLVIECVLFIIDKGVKDWFIVNGEILCFYVDMEYKWMILKDQMWEMDGVLEEILVLSKSQQFCDFIFSMFFNEVFIIGSGYEIFGSFFFLLVIMFSLGFDFYILVLKVVKMRFLSVNSSVVNR